MTRGDVWWVRWDDERCLVVLLSQEDEHAIRGMRIVAAAGTDITGIAVEVSIGGRDGLPDLGVLRVALPHPGRIMCQWLVTVTTADLSEHAGSLSAATLDELAEALRLGGLDWD
jgi:mRNA interferase MazF